MVKIVKYPRTDRIEGSHFRPGDEDLDSVSFSTICDPPVQFDIRETVVAMPIMECEWIVNN